MDTKIRLAIFDWLHEQLLIHGSVLTFDKLKNGFFYHGENITLLGSRGIWKPRQLEYPISIVSDPNGIYDDGFISDSLLNYSYEGKDPNFWTNVLLREAMKNQIPLIYLHKINKGMYYVHLPVYIVGDDPSMLKFVVAADQEINTSEIVSGAEESQALFLRREYATREVKQRLHQQTFRELVLAAYKNHCTICNLRHRELLDAAHIIPDSELSGFPIVQNGLSLCKIHHAAFDSNIIGISPDYIVHVREDILYEEDGPMLKYGIQFMDKAKIILPRNSSEWPDKTRLDERFEIFNKAV
ncbi:MAG TPA: HNH endonuclease [Bacteroidales bacterium]|jgi:putative restriction endonuclease|nr:HNH endonuclease [Paludibacteraceae bacterium]HPI31166.1 HNH endonuclease [Bacteroidales bacterium]HQN16699.1 HNH endonuclease [Bacteroidales bacterium]